MAFNLAEALRLVLVTDDQRISPRDLPRVCVAAVRGGVTAIQVRFKHLEARTLASVVRAVQSAVSVPVLVNDRLDVALACGVQGVHLGPDDLPVASARKIVPPGFWIGASVGSDAEARQAGAADYWGVGPLHGTATKPDAGLPIGLEGVHAVRGCSGGRPLIVIGGVQPTDVPMILEAGCVGVALVSGLLGGPDPEAAARAYFSPWAT